MKTTAMRIERVLPVATAFLLGCSGEGDAPSAQTAPLNQVGDCENASLCCPSGFTQKTLTSGADNFSSTTTKRCILALGGDDVVSSQTTGASAVFGGTGNDGLTVTGPGPNTVYGGLGNDNIFVTGSSEVVPGPGIDTLNTGNGSTTVYVFDLCEAPSGENLNGGGANDTLVIPVSLSQLRSRGVTANGFEHVVIKQNSCKSACVTKPNCSGHGQCAEGTMSGQVRCQCDAGWAGSNCSVPELVTPILSCVAELPGGVLKAVWSYQNDQSLSFTVAVGTRNAFSPAPADRGQPTTFSMGFHPGVVVTDLTGSLTWSLTGKTATATVDSPRCTVLPKDGTVVVDLGNGVLVPVGTVPPTGLLPDGGLPRINLGPSNPGGAGIAPIPDYPPGVQHCGPGLDLGSSQSGIHIQTRLTYPPPPLNTKPGTPGCRIAYQQCAPDGTPLPTPSEAELNSPVLPGDVCEAIPAQQPCGIDKTTIDFSPIGVCATDAQCEPRGMVCAQVCTDQDPACQSPQSRCAQQFASCRGLPRHTSCRTVHECRTPNARGSSDPNAKHALTGKPPSFLDQVKTVPADLAAPPRNAPLPPTYPRGTACTLAGGGKVTLPAHLDTRDANAGNDDWGVYAHPSVSMKASFDARPLGGEGDIDVEAQAGLQAGAHIWGADFKILDAGGSGVLKTCDITTTRFFTFLGQDVDIGGAPPIDTTTGNADSAACRAALFGMDNQNRANLGHDMKKAYFDALEVKKYYETAGLTKELCDETFKTAIPAKDCTTPADQMAALDFWFNRYGVTVKAFRDNQTALDGAKQKLSGLLPSARVPFLDIRRDFAAGPPEIAIPVGPATVVIDIEVSGFWGIGGDLELALARNPTAKITAKAALVPRLQATAFAYAGVGFGPVSFGVAGNLLLVDLTTTFSAGPEIRQRQVADPRPTEFASLHPPLAFPANYYYWTGDWTYGAHADLHYLAGEIDLQARISLLFWEETFSKEIARWDGYHNEFSFLGGTIPLTGYPDFGPIGEEITFPDPVWLRGSLVTPAMPVMIPVPKTALAPCPVITK